MAGRARRQVRLQGLLIEQQNGDSNSANGIKQDSMDNMGASAWVERSRMLQSLGNLDEEDEDSDDYSSDEDSSGGKTDERVRVRVAHNVSAFEEAAERDGGVILTLADRDIVDEHGNLIDEDDDGDALLENTDIASRERSSVLSQRRKFQKEHRGRAADGGYVAWAADEDEHVGQRRNILSQYDELEHDRGTRSLSGNGKGGFSGNGGESSSFAGTAGDVNQRGFVSSGDRNRAGFLALDVESAPDFPAKATGVKNSGASVDISMSDSALPEGRSGQEDIEVRSRLLSGLPRRPTLASDFRAEPASSASGATFSKRKVRGRGTSGTAAAILSAALGSTNEAAPETGTVNGDADHGSRLQHKGIQQQRQKSLLERQVLAQQQANDLAQQKAAEASARLFAAPVASDSLTGDAAAAFVLAARQQNAARLDGSNSGGSASDDFRSAVAALPVKRDQKLHDTAMLEASTDESLRSSDVTLGISASKLVRDARKKRRAVQERKFKDAHSGASDDEGEKVGLKNDDDDVDDDDTDYSLRLASSRMRANANRATGQSHSHSSKDGSTPEAPPQPVVELQSRDSEVAGGRFASSKLEKLPHAPIIGSAEPMADSDAGVASVLALLRTRGIENEMKQMESVKGRRSDKVLDVAEEYERRAAAGGQSAADVVSAHSSGRRRRDNRDRRRWNHDRDGSDDDEVARKDKMNFHVDLGYYDEITGRALSKKEAWRELCYGFHGYRPGKKRMEKQLKIWKEQLDQHKYASAEVGDSGIRGLTRGEQFGKGQRQQAKKNSGHDADLLNADSHKASSAGDGVFVLSGATAAHRKHNELRGRARHARDSGSASAGSAGVGDREAGLGLDDDDTFSLAASIDAGRAGFVAIEEPQPTVARAYAKIEQESRAFSHESAPGPRAVSVVPPTTTDEVKAAASTTLAAVASEIETPAAATSSAPVSSFQGFSLSSRPAKRARR